jgi:hypothetical protein
MVKNYSSAFLLSICLLAGANQMKAQKAFQRGSLMVSISEGSTVSKYKTSGVTGTASSATPGMYKSHENGVVDDSHPIEHGEPTCGVRDPLIVEYGVSDRISLGFSSGNDLFKVDPSTFYGFTRIDGAPVTAKTEELTFDGSYHFFVNKRLDLSAFAGIGMFNVAFKSQEVSDATPYNYSAKGNMARGGLRVRYYFYKHLGAFGQISSYTGKCSSNKVKENNLPGNYSTSISGSAIEAGLCYRFIR